MFKGNLNDNQLKDLQGVEECIDALVEEGYIQADILSEECFDQLSGITWLTLEFDLFKGGMIFKRLI